MSGLLDAIDAAEERKLAALGDDAMIVIPAADQQRAIFSGIYGLDHEELGEVVERVGYFFAHLAADGDMPLRKVMSSAWVDGFLVGLLYKE